MSALGSKPVKLRTKNVFRFAPESGLSICAFLEAISSGGRLDLHPRLRKLLALAGQPQIMPRQVFGLDLALGARWMILKVPSRPTGACPARRSRAATPCG